MINPIFYLLLIACFIHPLSTLAQKNYQPAKLYTTTGDSLIGFVDYRNWDTAPTTIQYRPSLDSPSVNFSASQIVSMIVADEFYLGKTVSLNEAPGSNADLDYSPNIITNTDTLFLRRLLGGDVSVYVAKWKGHLNFFVQKGETFELLKYKKYKKTVSGKITIQENRQYRGQLVTLLQECPDIKSKTSAMRYNAGDITDVVRYYNSCTGAKAIPGPKQNKERSFRAGLLGGVSFTYLQIENYPTGEFGSVITNLDFPASVNATGGFYFDAVFSRSRGAISLDNQLLYTSYDVQVSGSRGVYGLSEYDLVHYVSSTYIKFESAFAYRYLLSKGRHLFVKGGGALGFMIDHDNGTILTDVDNGEKRERTFIPEKRSIEAGFVLGLGAGIRRYGVEVKFEGNSGFVNDLYIKSPVQRLSFLLSYQLNKANSPSTAKK